MSQTPANLTRYLQSLLLQETLEKTTATLQAVLRETMEAPETGPRRELRLVQSKKHIENPPVNIFCTSLDV